MEASSCRVHVVSASSLRQLCGDSDSLFLDWINEQKFDLLGIDAPLSLPDCTQADYLFRPGDRRVGALSPFTIGELTARAIFLAAHIEASIVEVYPKAVLQMLGLPHRGYKQETVALAQRADWIARGYGWELDDLPHDSDSFDAFLALVSVWHYLRGLFINLSTDTTPFVLPIDPPWRASGRL